MQRSAIDVIVTLHYHRRSAAAVVERYRQPARRGAVGAAGERRERVHAARRPRLRTGRRAARRASRRYASGREDEVVLWLPAAGRIVSGDVLLGGVRKPYRVCPQSWLPKDVRRADVAAALAPLLDLPVSLLVPTHGPPVTEGAAEALEAALAEARGQ